MKNLKQELVDAILTSSAKQPPKQQFGEAFAPANIALCKYWGKRVEELNLPFTNSLSISLGDRGTHTRVEINDCDEIYLNNKAVGDTDTFYVNIIKFLDLFRPTGMSFKVSTKSNIPIGAGVASSASGFAALVQALNILFGWGLSMQQLSILARLGSGSACRSLWQGFVEWEKGARNDGFDSFAKPLPLTWRQLRLGLLLYSIEQKSVSSRQAMAATVRTCPFYSLWPDRVQTAIHTIKDAINKRDFMKFGQTAETNALEMHAMMLATTPSIIYSNEDTIAGMQQVWQTREQGIAVYFTQDAGPNLKLLFLENEEQTVRQLFPGVEIINPWERSEAPGLLAANVGRLG